MKTKTFNERGKALEDLFFQNVDQKLLERLRDEIDGKETKRDIRSACGIRNDAVLSELANLGVRGETILAVSLIPLVAVAWADGNVSAEERSRILEAEEAQHIDSESATHQLLNYWLDNNPGPQMLESWKHFIYELRGLLTPAHGTLFDAEIMERSEAVAKASGGYFTYGAISPSEQKVLDEVTETLKAAHPA